MTADHTLHIIRDSEGDIESFTLDCHTKTDIYVSCPVEDCPADGHYPEHCDKCRCHNKDKCNTDCRKNGWKNHHEPGCCCNCACSTAHTPFHGVDHYFFDGHWYILSDECACKHETVLSDIENFVYAGDYEDGDTYEGNLEYDQEDDCFSLIPSIDTQGQPCE